jgi:hypothetical protein
MPTPAPCLLVLRAQIDTRYPSRHKASDGIMGDASHRQRKSDHNQGNAIDLTHSPGHGFDAGLLAESLRLQMQAYPAGRVSYLIFMQRIASPFQGWRWRRYRGPNPHTNHLHISVMAATRHETRRWKID